MTGQLFPPYGHGGLGSNGSGAVADPVAHGDTLD
jgi:hypothetical protein